MPSFEVRSFGPFTLDLSRNQLHRGKIEIRMQPQPFRLLVLLTSRPGELITREEIQKELWEPDTFVDFEQGLNYAIRRVREALNDSGATPVYLKTEPKRGYRFIGLVQRTETAASSPQPPNGSPPTTVPIVPTMPVEPIEATVVVPAETAGRVAEEGTSSPAQVARERSVRRGWKVAALMAVVLAIVGLFVSMARRRAHPLSIAVLPIENLTGKSENDALADNLTDALAAQLRMMGAGHVRIMSLDSGDTRQAPHEDPEVTGRTLGATFVLSGSLHPAQNGSEATLGLQLIRSSDGGAAWSRYEESGGSRILSDSNQLAAEILSSKEIGGAPIGKTVSVYLSPSPVAQAAFERGKRALVERSQEGLNAAADEFKQATRADPHFADAFAQLAITYDLLGQYGWTEQKAARERASAAAEQALLLSPSLADAHAAKGFEEWFYEWNWVAAEADFQTALQAEPANIDALHWYGLALATRGQLKQGTQQMELALHLEPRSKILQTNRGWLDYMGGNYPGAANRMEAVLRNDPYYFSARLKLWAVYTAEQKPDEAVQQLGFMSLDLLDPEEREVLYDIYRQRGYKPALQSWGGKISERVRSSLFGLQLAVASGDKDAAVRALLRGYAEHDGWMVFAPTDPLLKPMLSDARLAGLRERLMQGQGKPE